MRHTRFHSRHAPVRRAPGAHPSPFVLVISLLLFASVLLVGAGVVALLLAPFAILIGTSLLVCSLSLLCLVGIAKGCFALARGITRWLSHRPMCSALLPAIIHLQILLARMLTNWLANWLANHDPAAAPPGTSSASSHQTRVSPLLEGA
jgi:hypothetical protein